MSLFCQTFLFLEPSCFMNIAVIPIILDLSVVQTCDSTLVREKKWDDLCINQSMI